GCGQRSNAGCHSQTEYQHRRKECGPVATADSRSREQCEAGSGNQRADSKWQSRPKARDQSAGPSREEEHQKDERQKRCARLGGRISLHLDQVERKEKQHAAKSCIEKEREQVGGTKVSGTEKRQRNH